MCLVRRMLSYTVALFMIVVALATLMGGNFFAAKLANTTGIKVSPWYTGGEVVKVIDHGGYRTLIHRPVFDALFGQTQEGFVQIDWQPLAALPETMEEDIDCFNSGNAACHIRLDTKTPTAQVTVYNPQVIGLEKSYKLKDGLAVRVLLRRE
ncbi:MAG: hypothetical protein H6Q75_556 [Firmicutes bacterium]|nr:hypothetical protein [Bacillota bacterium]